MSRILVIGKNSFIGKNFEKYSVFKDINFVSIREKKIEDIDFKNYDIVLHLAAIVHQTRKIEEQEYFRINRDLCLEVAQSSKKNGVKQFVFLSTIKVFGNQAKESIILNENSICLPNDAYGKSKYMAELGLKEIEDESFKVAIVRTPLVYGEGVGANMLKMINLVQNFFILPFGNIKNRRSMTYVGNLVGFIDRIIEKQVSGIFIAQDTNPISTTELTILIAEALSRKIKLIVIPRFLLKFVSLLFPNLTIRLFESLEFDNTFTKEFLEYIPEVSTNEGIKRMVESYLKNN